jgi:hypothetical protein
MRRQARWLGGIAICLAIFTGWQLIGSAQQPATEKGKTTADSNRLAFEVVHSFDAKYEGDTPGHMGRAGGLQNRRLRAALGDSIYRGDQSVGTVTGLTWNRTNGSLDIEFDPAENTRISVGDEVWMLLDGSAAAKGAR